MLLKQQTRYETLGIVAAHFASWGVAPSTRILLGNSALKCRENPEVKTPVRKLPLGAQPTVSTPVEPAHSLKGKL